MSPRYTLQVDYSDLPALALIRPNRRAYMALHPNVYVQARPIEKGQAILLIQQAIANNLTMNQDTVIEEHGHAWLLFEYGMLHGYHDVEVWFDEDIHLWKANLGVQAYYNVHIPAQPYVGGVAFATDEDRFVWLKWSSNLRSSYGSSDQWSARTMHQLNSHSLLKKGLEENRDGMTRYLEAEILGERVMPDEPDLLVRGTADYTWELKLNDLYLVHVDVEQPGYPLALVDSETDEVVSRHRTVLGTARGALAHMMGLIKSEMIDQIDMEVGNGESAERGDDEGAAQGGDDQDVDGVHRAALDVQGFSCSTGVPVGKGAFS